MSLIKTAEEIQLLKQGGRILAEILDFVCAQVKPGVSTGELNALAESLIEKAGGRPSFKGYGEPEPFPAGLCVSVNEEVVHGIPSFDRILSEGDIVSLDVGMEFPAKNGLYTDMAKTVPVGKISKEAEKLMKITKGALQIWLEECRPGRDLNEIAKEVQQYIEKNGFAVVRDLVGHGVGHAVHEAPSIPNYYLKNAGFRLREGMVLAFEPMVTLGGYRVKTLADDWTVVTADGELSAHFEHTVAITAGGCLVITQK